MTNNETSVSPSAEDLWQNVKKYHDEEKDYKKAWDCVKQAWDIIKGNEFEDKEILKTRIIRNAYIAFDHAFNNRQQFGQITETILDDLYLWQIDEETFLQKRSLTLVLPKIEYEISNPPTKFISDFFKSFVPEKLKSDKLGTREKIVLAYETSLYWEKQNNIEEASRYLIYCDEELNNFHNWNNDRTLREEIYYHCGRFYLFGNQYYQCDYLKAISYLEKSGYNGYPLLGYIYENGLGCDKDFAKAFAYYNTHRNSFLETRLLFFNYVNRLWIIFDPSTSLSTEPQFEKDMQDLIEAVKQLMDTEKADCSSLNLKPNPLLDQILKREIKNVVNSINSLLKFNYDQDIIEKLNNITIEYSYEEKKNESGFNLKEIINQILDILNLLQASKNNTEDEIKRVQIEEQISIINSLSEELLEDSIDEDNIKKYVKQINCEILDNRKLSKQLRNLTEILEKRISYILGEYSDSEFKIILYLKNIYNSSCELSIDKEVFTLTVFAHELFHAFHALKLVENGSNCSASFQHRSIVDESLARYFEFYYSKEGLDFSSLNNSIDIIEKELYPSNRYKYIEPTIISDRKKSYQKMMENIYSSIFGDMYCDPYSGAYYYLKDEYYADNVGYKEEKKLPGTTKFGNNIFRRVFCDSLKSIKKAYEDLKFFYDIDNMD